MWRKMKITKFKLAVPLEIMNSKTKLFLIKTILLTEFHSLFLLLFSYTFFMEKDDNWKQLYTYVNKII